MILNSAQILALLSDLAEAVDYADAIHLDAASIYDRAAAALAEGEAFFLDASELSRIGSLTAYLLGAIEDAVEAAVEASETEGV